MTKKTVRTDDAVVQGMFTIAELTALVEKLEARVDVLERGPEAEKAPERKTGWAVICSLPDMPFIFCGRDGFQPIRKVSDVLEKHGARWVVWFDTHVDAKVCIKLAQLGDDFCKVVQLDRETLEEVEASK